MNREATNSEKAWWRKFRLLLKNMPITLEVQVSAHGNLTAGPRGAVEKALDGGGDAGSADSLDLFTLHDVGFKDASGGL